MFWLLWPYQTKRDCLGLHIKHTNESGGGIRVCVEFSPYPPLRRYKSRADHHAPYVAPHPESLLKPRTHPSWVCDHWWREWTCLSNKTSLIKKKKYKSKGKESPVKSAGCRRCIWATSASVFGWTEGAALLGSSRLLIRCFACSFALGGLLPENNCSPVCVPPESKAGRWRRTFVAGKLGPQSSKATWPNFFLQVKCQSAILSVLFENEQVVCLVQLKLGSQIIQNVIFTEIFKFVCKFLSWK